MLPSSCFFAGRESRPYALSYSEAKMWIATIPRSDDLDTEITTDGHDHADRAAKVAERWVIVTRKFSVIMSGAFVILSPKS